jgi:hypothetical protein
MARVEIEGVSDLLRKLDNAPDQMVKDVKKALRKAASAEARGLRRSVPDSARGLVKSKVKGVRSGDISATFGLFGKQGDPDMEWFHWYWKNYGTLEGRDPAHRFEYAIKGGQAAARRRNNRGERHVNFFESVVGGFQSRFLSNFRKALKDLGYDIG